MHGDWHPWAGLRRPQDGVLRAGARQAFQISQQSGETRRPGVKAFLVHAAASQASRGYDGRPFEQARPGRVDEQTLEGNEHLAIDVVQNDILDFQIERERIGADRPDAQIAIEILRYRIDRKADCDPGQNEEASKGVQDGDGGEPETDAARVQPVLAQPGPRGAGGRCLHGLALSTPMDSFSATIVRRRAHSIYFICSAHPGAVDPVAEGSLPHIHGKPGDRTCADGNAVGSVVLPDEDK